MSHRDRMPPLEWVVTIKVTVPEEVVRAYTSAEIQAFVQQEINRVWAGHLAGEVDRGMECHYDA